MNLRLKNSATLFFLLLSPFLASPLFAQDRILRYYKIDFNLGYALSTAPNQKYGLAFSVEPKYGFTDNLWLGLKVEGAAISFQTDPFIGIGIGSTLITGEYSLLLTNNFRPFLGFGLGPYFQKGIYKNSNDDPNNKFVTNLGSAPRIGFEYRHFRLGLEYNIIQDSFDYYGFKLGFV